MSHLYEAIKLEVLYQECVLIFGETSREVFYNHARHSWPAMMVEEKLRRGL